MGMGDQVVQDGTPWQRPATARPAKNPISKDEQKAIVESIEVVQI
jgi:hypothetical protein